MTWTHQLVSLSEARAAQTASDDCSAFEIITISPPINCSIENVADYRRSLICSAFHSFLS